MECPFDDIGAVDTPIYVSLDKDDVVIDDVDDVDVKGFSFM